MSKDGYILIEVLVATAIASIISAALFAAYYGINRARVALENNIDYHERMIILNEQLMQDFSGACLPTPPEENEQKDGTQDSKSNLLKNNQNKDTEKDQKKIAQKDTTGDVLPLKEKPVPYIFYSVNSGDETQGSKQVQLVTFLTNNPLQTYWDGKIGKPKARLVRVAYTLTQELNNKSDVSLLSMPKAVHAHTPGKIKKTSYMLMRHEFDDLTLTKESLAALVDESKREHFGSAREKPSNTHDLTHDAHIDKKGHTSFTLIRGIKNLTFAYGVTTHTKKENDAKKSKGTAAQEKDNLERNDSGTFETLQTWDHEKEDTSEKQFPKIPELVTCTVTLWGTTYRQEKTFTLKLPILPNFDITQKESSDTKKDLTDEKNIPLKTTGGGA